MIVRINHERTNKDAFEQRMNYDLHVITIIITTVHVQYKLLNLNQEDY